MNDKTLKIRIKLHSSGTSPEPPSIDPDEVERRDENPAISRNSSSKTLPRIVGSVGVAALLFAGVYLFSTGDSNDPEKTAAGSTDVAENSMQNSTGISNHSEPLKTADRQTTSVSDDSAVHSSVETDDQPTPRVLAESISNELPPDKPMIQINSENVESSLYTDNSSAISTDQNISASETRTEKTTEVLPPKHYAAASIVTTVDEPKATEPNTISKKKPPPQSIAQPLSEPTLIEPPSSPIPQVSRAQFTSGIKSREPVDTVRKTFYSDGLKSKRLYYFTELHGMKGDSITHRWNHEGQIVANVTFNISGDRWRVYSSKNLPSSMKGQWNVVVTDASGNHLVSDSFVYD